MKFKVGEVIQHVHLSDLEKRIGDYRFVVQKSRHKCGISVYDGYFIDKFGNPTGMTGVCGDDDYFELAK